MDLQSLLRRREELLLARQENLVCLARALGQHTASRPAPAWYDSSPPEQPDIAGDVPSSLIWSPNGSALAAGGTHMVRVYRLDGRWRLLHSCRLESDEQPVLLLDDGTLVTKRPAAFDVINENGRSIHDTEGLDVQLSIHHGRWIGVCSGTLLRIFDGRLGCWTEVRYVHHCRIKTCLINDDGTLGIVHDEQGEIHSAKLSAPFGFDAESRLLFSFDLAHGLVYLLFFRPLLGSAGHLIALVVTLTGVNVWSIHPCLRCVFPTITGHFVVALDDDAREIVCLSLPRLAVVERLSLGTSETITGLRVATLSARFIAILVKGRGGAAVMMVRRRTRRGSTNKILK